MVDTDTTLHLVLGGVAIRVGADSTSLDLDAHQAHFRASGAAPAASQVELTYVPGGSSARRGTRRFTGGPWEVFERADAAGWVIAGPHPTIEAVCSSDYEQVEVALDPWPSRIHVGAHVREVELPTLGRLALSSGGFLVHACGLALAGRGLLVAGSSGRGKSTLSGLVAREEVLSDERILLRPGADGAPELHGTPWPGTAGLARCGRAPLAALLLLGPHGTAPGLRPLSRAEACRRLVFQAFLPLWDGRGVERCLAFADEVTRRVPAFELTFRPDASARSLLEEVLR